ncbi:MAG TPA: hypothetical protein QGI22_03570 [Candidatus Woesearchaeota archaeon]|jgi:hypothetical protein|nr:hypothetical protein [Candidatus Woesearchaeota archaeon]|tara:strand:+ start:23066 stop:23191 length:126 start_codon:yes stop_codon:yes gene_type:complete
MGINIGYGILQLEISLLRNIGNAAKYRGWELEEFMGIIKKQ